MKDINRLIKTYVDYLHMNFDIEKLEKNIYKVTTPFLDRRNDHITIYIILEKDKIKITDDSYTIDDLELEGLSFTKKREIELNRILLGYGIHKKNNELFVITDRSSFAQKKHNFIQALLTINDMYLLSSQKVSTFFIDDVREYFDKKELIYTDNISIEGKSKIIHKFDFLIPKQITPYKKEALIKTINTPKIENIKAILFSFEDVKNNRPDKGFVVLNDKTPINEKIYEALNNYNITPLHWSNINNDYSKLFA